MIVLRIDDDLYNIESWTAITVDKELHNIVISLEKAKSINIDLEFLGDAEFTNFVEQLYCEIDFHLRTDGIIDINKLRDKAIHG